MVIFSILQITELRCTQESDSSKTPQPPSGTAGSKSGALGLGGPGLHHHSTRSPASPFADGEGSEGHGSGACRQGRGQGGRCPDPQPRLTPLPVGESLLTKSPAHSTGGLPASSRRTRMRLIFSAPFPARQATWPSARTEPLRQSGADAGVQLFQGRASPHWAAQPKQIPGQRF